MKKLCAIFLAALILFVIKAQVQSTTPLQLEQTITLPNVAGRIDHMVVDIASKRLFLAALGNNTLEVIDLPMGSRVHSIGGLQEPQGVIYIPEFKKIFVTNGGDGSCRIFDVDSFKFIKSIDLKEDADNVRYDATTKHIYVGYGKGALGIIDAANGKRLGDIKLTGHPKSFQLEKTRKRIFVNARQPNMSR